MKQVELTAEEVELLIVLIDQAIQDGYYEASEAVLEKLLTKVGG